MSKKHTLVVNPADPNDVLVVTATLITEDEAEFNEVPVAMISFWQHQNNLVGVGMDLKTREDQEGAIKVLGDIQRAVNDLREQVLNYKIEEPNGNDPQIQD